jgi:hypothetical protein
VVPDLEDADHDLTLAEQHPAVVAGEVGVLGGEDLRHGAAVGQQLLQD